MQIDRSKLTRLRELAGLSQQDLARLAGVSRPYLNQLESGAKTDPQPPVVARLAKVLGVAIVDLT